MDQQQADFLDAPLVDAMGDEPWRDDAYPLYSPPIPADAVMNSPAALLFSPKKCSQLFYQASDTLYLMTATKPQFSTPGPPFRLLREV